MARFSSITSLLWTTSQRTVCITSLCCLFITWSSRTGFYAVGIDYFLGDPVHLHTESGFDRQAWFAKSRKQADELVEKWVDGVRELYGTLCHLLLFRPRAPFFTINQQETTLYDLLLDQWWGKFDNMSEPRHRKITAMGIAALVSTGRPEVLQRLPGEIFNFFLP